MKRIILSLGVLLMLAQNGFAISDTQYVAYSNGRKATSYHRYTYDSSTETKRQACINILKKIDNYDNRTAGYPNYWIKGCTEEIQKYKSPW